MRGSVLFLAAAGAYRILKRHGRGKLVVNMSVKADAGRGGIVELSEAEAARIFDKIAQENLHMSGAEFLRRWDAGEYEGKDWDAVPGLAEVAMLISFAR
jgi:hypothetical protein